MAVSLTRYLPRERSSQRTHQPPFWVSENSSRGKEHIPPKSTAAASYAHRCNRAGQMHQSQRLYSARLPPFRVSENSSCQPRTPARKTGDRSQLWAMVTTEIAGWVVADSNPRLAEIIHGGQRAPRAERRASICADFAQGRWEASDNEPARPFKRQGRPLFPTVDRLARYALPAERR